MERDDFHVSNAPREDEVRIWVGNREKSITGVTEETTCLDVVHSLLKHSKLANVKTIQEHMIFQKWPEYQIKLQGHVKILNEFKKCQAKGVSFHMQKIQSFNSSNGISGNISNVSYSSTNHNSSKRGDCASYNSENISSSGKSRYHNSARSYQHRSRSKDDASSEDSEKSTTVGTTRGREVERYDFNIPQKQQLQQSTRLYSKRSAAARSRERQSSNRSGCSSGANRGSSSSNSRRRSLDTLIDLCVPNVANNREHSEELVNMSNKNRAVNTSCLSPSEAKHETAFDQQPETFYGRGGLLRDSRKRDRTRTQSYIEPEANSTTEATTLKTDSLTDSIGSYKQTIDKLNCIFNLDNTNTSTQEEASKSSITAAETNLIRARDKGDILDRKEGLRDEQTQSTSSNNCTDSSRLFNLANNFRDPTNGYTHSAQQPENKGGDKLAISARVRSHSPKPQTHRRRKNSSLSKHQRPSITKSQTQPDYPAVEKGLEDKLEFERCKKNISMQCSELSNLQQRIDNVEKQIFYLTQSSVTGDSLRDNFFQNNNSSLLEPSVYSSPKSHSKYKQRSSKASKTSQNPQIIAVQNEIKLYLDKIKKVDDTIKTQNFLASTLQAEVKDLKKSLTCPNCQIVFRNQRCLCTLHHELEQSKMRSDRLDKESNNVETQIAQVEQDIIKHKMRIQRLEYELDYMEKEQETNSSSTTSSQYYAGKPPRIPLGYKSQFTPSQNDSQSPLSYHRNRAKSADSPIRNRIHKLQISNEVNNNNNSNVSRYPHVRKRVETDSDTGLGSMSTEEDIKGNAAPLVISKTTQMAI